MEGSELTPQMINVLLALSYILGVVARVLWPYMLAYFKEPQSFDFEKVKGQVIAAFAGLIFAALTSGTAQIDLVGSFGVAGYLAAFVAGFGVAAVGREGQKTLDVRSAKKN